MNRSTCITIEREKIEQKNESLNNMDIAIWTKLLDFKSPFLAGDLKPHR